MIKAVLFDLDNTLINFMKMKKKSCEAAVSAMVDSGLKMNKKAALKLLYELYEKHGMEDHTIFQKLLIKISKKIDHQILAKGIDAYRKAQIATMEPYPGVIPTLIKLKEKGIKLAIVSDAPKLKAYLRLVELRIVDFFDIVVALEDTGKTKPSPEPFKRALKMLKLKPEEAVFIGDMLERDIKGAMRVGIMTVHAKYGSSCVSDVCPDHSISKIENLLKIVR